MLLPPNPAAGLFQARTGLQLALLIVVIMAACMVMSDGVLTPAISVISAIEGLQFNTGISQGRPADCRELPCTQRSCHASE